MKQERDEQTVERKLFAKAGGLCQVVLVGLFAAFVRYADTASATAAANATVATYYGFFQDVHVMIFIGIGFLMTFLRRYGYSAVSLNFLLGAFVIQWAILANGLMEQVFDGPLHLIRVDIRTLITSDFAAAVVLISFGAFIGHATPLQALFIAGAEVLFYAANERYGVHELKAVDMGGSIFIHTFGAYFGLACSKALLRGRYPAGKEFEDQTAGYRSDLSSMIGTVFLWMFWPSFNGVLAPSNANSQHRVIINTVLALTASCITAFVISSLLSKNGKFEMEHIQNATLAGGVAVGSSADLVIEPWGALLIGMLGGAVSTWGFYYLTAKLQSAIGLRDTCGIHNLHGMPGVVGAVAGAVSAYLASDSEYGQSVTVIYPARDTRSAMEQAEYQLLALGVTMGVALVTGYITGLVARLLPSAKSAFRDDEYFVVPSGVEYDSATAPLASSDGATEMTSM